MTRRLVSIDPLEISKSLIGRKVIVTVRDEVTAGGVSDVLQVGPDEWSDVVTKFPRLPKVPTGLTGCVLWVGGRVVIVTATSHVVVEIEADSGAEA